MDQVAANNMFFFKSFICLVRGHDLSHARYFAPFQMMSTPMISINIDGSYNYHNSEPTGFMHYGIVADCKRCGKCIDADNTNLPILEPKFTGE